MGERYVSWAERDFQRKQAEAWSERLEEIRKEQEQSDRWVAQFGEEGCYCWGPCSHV